MMFTVEASVISAACHRLPYQSVQAGASRCGRVLLGAVGLEAGVEHIRDATGRPAHS